MDIKNLLSPDSNSQSGKPAPAPGGTNTAPPSTASPSPRKAIHRARTGTARKSKPSSPLAQQIYAPAGRPEPSSATATSTGMDTLADLAAMQHHQPQRPNATNVLRGPESYEHQLSPSTINPHVNPINHNTPTPRTSFDIAMSEGPREKNSHTYDAHVRFIGLLHAGFVNHVYPPNNPDIHGDPRRYDLLKDMRTAREEMDKLFAMGEDLWAEWIQDESMLAHSAAEREAVMILCQRSVNEEFGSTKLWHIYGEWMLYLYTSANGEGGGAGQWTEEDRQKFTWQSVLEVWREAAESTRWRINNSHLVWDRYLNLLTQDVARAPSQEKIEHLKGLFDSRLQTPHATWDQTFQSFSSFISTYYESKYEGIMAATVDQSAKAKNLYASREDFERRLSEAEASGDRTLEYPIYAEYIDWEVNRPRQGRRAEFHIELANAIFQRAVLRFPTDVTLWEDHVMFLLDESMHQHPSKHNAPTRAPRQQRFLLSIVELVTALEREGRSFATISDLKHRATRTGLLDAGGMEEVLKVHTTWCSYLRRRAFLSDATDEDLDVAEVGIRSAIESVQELGEKKYGRSYQGDPLFRLERIYIRYLSESGSWDSARETFKGLVKRLGHSYEFWITYYNWELISWSKFVQVEATVDAARRTPNPSYATAVLKEAIRRTDLDWPEKVVQVYLSHCEDYEDSDELQIAVIETRKAMRAVTSRREREAAAAAAQQQQQQQQQMEAAIEAASSSEKRKRDDEHDLNGEPTHKRMRSEDISHSASTEPDAPSRDREHSTVIVKNIAKGTPEIKIRQFFREVGTINGVKMIPGQNTDSESAIVEFETRKMPMDVQPYAQTTLWVTNFPAAADDEYIRSLFGKYGRIIDIRWPSLKFQVSRRFCYVQFDSSSAAHQATELNGTDTEEGHKLIAKISDPEKKQERGGALAEGREIFCKNLDWKVKEEDVSNAFSKFGTVEHVVIPKMADGRSKGICFVTFSSKEEATAALAMDDEFLKSRRLHVEPSTKTGAKRMTHHVISRVKTSASPVPEVNGEDSEAVETTGERWERTIALLNVPDTVNEARIRTLVEPWGRLVQISLRPDHQGALVEYVDVHDAGKAAMALDGKEIVAGRQLKIGGIQDLKAMRPEYKSDRVTSVKKEKPALPSPRPSNDPNNQVPEALLAMEAVAVD
ncbi:hypothetical protein N7470_002441 [Penicillium chermesinum]|nr:hypothetical protein N7470_002441 [Penicillium chermesinum]